MTRTLISTFLIFCFYSLTAQSIDTRINKKIDSLRNIGVDTFLVYHINCVGSIIISNDKCTITETKFLWWTQMSATYVQIFDNCYSYSVIKNDTLKSLTFYINNKYQIDNETIKQAENRKVISYKRNGKKYKREEVRYSTVDHSCHDIFKFMVDTTIITKDCDNYDLQFKQFDDGLPNTNWEYNQATKLKVLIDIINKETADLKKIFTEHRQ